MENKIQKERRKVAAADHLANCERALAALVSLGHRVMPFRAFSHSDDAVAFSWVHSSATSLLSSIPDTRKQEAEDLIKKFQRAGR